MDQPWWLRWKTYMGIRGHDVCCCVYGWIRNGTHGDEKGMNGSQFLAFLKFCWITLVWLSYDY